MPLPLDVGGRVAGDSAGGRSAGCIASQPGRDCACPWAPSPVHAKGTRGAHGAQACRGYARVEEGGGDVCGRARTHASFTPPVPSGSGARARPEACMPARWYVSWIPG